MLNNDLYPYIFRRKSFHLFRGTGTDIVTIQELREIESAWRTFGTLYPDIRTALRIVPSSKVHFRRDAEYCILIYSEKKDNYLLNAGYMGEQLDLYLVSRGIGTLWFGIGKPDEPSYDGLDHVIMIAIRKVNDGSLFRKNMYKAKRKPSEEIWQGDPFGLAEIARFAPSACNSQPWYVKSEAGTLTVFRYKKPGKRGIMPAGAVGYFNRIDIGIFLCFLEIIMAEKEISAARELFIDAGDEEYTPVAKYTIG
ncbi:MAG: nitroreductase family protein [Clostridia bacterium]|nr:nitroreductase family protein [Clostridia bacterium]